MKKNILLISLASLFLLFSCEKEESARPQPVDRTILVYLAADNNLVGNAYKNLTDMAAGMKSAGGNLIVYIDPYNYYSANGTTDFPRLLKIESDGTQRVVETYAQENSASAEVLARVLARTKALYPAKSYGLVLWSHGNGWIPSPSMERSRSLMPDIWEKDPNALPTKWFGQDVPRNGYMNISDMAAVLPKDRSLDFILFDACFMGSVEVMYDLRQAARYIVSSPAEILASGFPYQSVLPLLFSETLQLEKTCRAFVDFYRNYRYPSATISLVNTSELDKLAASARTLLSAFPNAVVETSDIQPYEAMRDHFYHDLEDYYAHIASGTVLDDFREQLARTVIYADHTDNFYSAYGSDHWVKVNAFSGLSTYITRTSSPVLETGYFDTSWARAVGLSE